MTERNVANGMTAVFLTELIEFLYPLRWFGVLAFIVIMADLRFGTLAAKKRGEKVRFSRAIRRTANKMVDYICWLLLAASFGIVFGEPFGIVTLREIILFVIFGAELNSCFGNFFEYRGLNFKVDVFKFIGKKTDIIDPEKKQENEKHSNYYSDAFPADELREHQEDQGGGEGTGGILTPCEPDHGGSDSE